MSAVTLQRDAWGRWVLTLADGQEHVPVTVVRAYPVSAPEEGVAVMDAEGHELWWCDRLPISHKPWRRPCERLCRNANFYLKFSVW